MPDTPAPTACRAVFISHAHEDALAAQRISEALRKAGIDVWFDQNELTGGDAWDAKIRRQIAECALFIPLVSANTQARLEGYFRIEWKLAAQRTHAMAEEKCFLIPVVIDATREAEAKVPVEFRAAQWTRLPGGETTPAFAGCVRRLLGGASQGASPAQPATTVGHGAAVAPAPVKSRGVPSWAVIAIGSVAALAITLALVLRNRPGLEPAAVVAVAVPTSKAAPPVALNRLTLAVLPFDNFSSEKEKFDYFADGMTEQMTSRLSRVSGLTVKARNAVKNFKRENKDIAAIGRELGVGCVLESSVRREGNQLRITVQLIDVQTLNHLWSQDFDEPFEQILTIQSTVAERVAAALKVELLGDERRSIRRRPTENTLAYDYFLQGFFEQHMDRERTLQSIALLEKAVALDNTFAEAYANLGYAYTIRAYFMEAEPKEWEDRADAAVATALRLNPDLPEAHLAYARLLIRRSKNFNYEGAIAEARQALALRSNLDEAHEALGGHYFHVGLIVQSREQYKKADEINPSNPKTKFELAVSELYHGRFDQAFAMMKGFKPKFFTAIVPYRRASALFYAGRTEDAKVQVAADLAEIRKDPKSEDTGGILTSMQALFLAAEGNKAEAEIKIAEAEKLGERYGHFHHTAHVIASAYSLLNEPTPAIDWLRRAALDGYPNITWFRRDPHLANLRKDPRFEQLMAELQPRFERLKALAETPIAGIRRATPARN